MKEPIAGICPHCGDDEITGMECNVEGEYMYQEMDCSACEKNWVDEYRLIRQVNGGQFGDTLTLKEEK